MPHMMILFLTTHRGRIRCPFDGCDQPAIVDTQDDIHRGHQIATLVSAHRAVETAFDAIDATGDGAFLRAFEVCEAAHRPEQVCA